MCSPVGCRIEALDLYRGNELRYIVQKFSRDVEISNARSLEVCFYPGQLPMAGMMCTTITSVYCNSNGAHIVSQVVVLSLSMICSWFLCCFTWCVFLFAWFALFALFALSTGEKNSSAGVRECAVDPPERISRGRKSRLPRRQQGKTAGYPCRKVNTRSMALDKAVSLYKAVSLHMAVLITRYP